MSVNYTGNSLIWLGRFPKRAQGATMIRENQFPVLNYIVPQHVLVSTFDKGGLEVLVESVLGANPEAKFYSTGGTGMELQKVLGSRANTNYVSVETFTGCPEMEGGLVKTLHPKIHAGLLAERLNPAHRRYLEVEMAQLGTGPGVFFDICAVNLYPFEKVVENSASAEVARSNIDIGGPTMVMASAKNWHSVAVLTNPDMYRTLEELLQNNKGCVPAASRFQFAVVAMEAVASFRLANYRHFVGLNYDQDVLPTVELI